MTPAELKAAGWEPESVDPLSWWHAWCRGGWRIATTCYKREGCAELTQTGVRFPIASGASHLLTGRDGHLAALESLGNQILPDGRTVREWALSPP